MNSSNPTSPVYPDRVTITGRRRNSDLDALHERQIARLGEQLLHHVHRLRSLHRQEAPVLVIHQVERPSAGVSSKICSTRWAFAAFGTTK